MRHRWMHVHAVWLAAVLLVPRSAAAQTPDRDSTEFFGGYSYLHDHGNGVLAETASDDNYPLGWFAGVAHRVWRKVDLVGEVGGQYKSGITLAEDARLSLHSFLGGPRASIRWGPAILFTQALAGGTYAHASAFGATVGSTKFTLQGGGGVDYPVSAHLATRLQLDYRMIPPLDGLDLTSQFRVAAGLVYR